MSEPPVVNHIGIAVSDRDRAQAFYVDCLGFTYLGSLAPEDGSTGRLLQVEDPHLVARYLQSGSVVLELLQFDAGRSGRPNEREFLDLGLTHLSFTVPDVRATLDQVRAHGGTVLEDTAIVRKIGDEDVIVAIVVVDPDGQRLELLQVWSGPPTGPHPPL